MKEVVFKDFNEINEKNNEMHLHWQYLNGYINDLLNNLELIEKVKDKRCTMNEYALCVKTFFNNNIKDIKSYDIVFLHYKYKRFVIEELSKYKKILMMMIDDNRLALNSLNMTLERLNNIEDAR